MRTTDWANAMERHALGAEHLAMRTARSNFRSVLDREEQHQLAAEAAETRRRELTLAYDNVVAVHAGYRLKRDTSGRYRVRTQVCLVLVVRAKRRIARGSHQNIPRFLLAYWKKNGRSLLCAIPTDVVPASHFARIQPQAGRTAVSVRAPDVDVAVNGALCCSVRIEGRGEAFAISCRHVLSMLDPSVDPDAIDLPVTLIDETAPILGTTTLLRGELAESGTNNLDAQLMRLSAGNSERLARALGELTFAGEAPYCRTYSEVPDVFWIATPRYDGKNRPIFIQVQKVAQINFCLDYEIKNLENVPLHDLIQVQCVNDSTLHGDSGSPAIANVWGQKLVGMHIAGDKLGRGLIIPAWRLLNPANYGRPRDQWALT